MPAAWSDKDERQYEHIKDSSVERGVNEDKAEEIAARTVNKRRRVEGRTPNRRTQGTGNPNRALDERSRDEVYNRAKEMHIRGRSKMTKAELVEAVRHQSRRG
jgi:plasmid stabilization system protein ParE